MRDLRTEPAARDTCPDGSSLSLHGARPDRGTHHARRRRLRSEKPVEWRLHRQADCGRHPTFVAKSIGTQEYWASIHSVDGTGAIWRRSMLIGCRAAMNFFDCSDGAHHARASRMWFNHPAASRVIAEQHLDGLPGRSSDPRYRLGAGAYPGHHGRPLGCFCRTVLHRRNYRTSRQRDAGDVKISFCRRPAGLCQR